jgi:hypothetical protein
MASVALSKSISMPSVLSISRPCHVRSRSRATRSCAAPSSAPGSIAKAFGKLGAVDHIGQQQGARFSLIGLGQMA